MNTDKPNSQLPADDFSLFREAISGTTQFKQDTVQQVRRQTRFKGEVIAEQKKQHQAEFYFSDEYVPDIDTYGTVNYVRPGADKYLAKQLRRGDYAPELILDMHGMNKETAKDELAALIHACKKQHVACACVVHGIGERVLKHKVPQYLVQHPDILAIHQAPLEYGGKGAVLILVDLPQSMEFRR
ncbi:endonuclease SmrB [Pseudoalteromonas sp. OOF1S-7]|uniref:endonuclease SmrB n=1 Tax=Pseudoalteromonas sp. OOF1S-7 TaxID=2917757 RepID=UPI001EF57981|nr:endonuclease SmrB [Pseudoalteromonas sp. OOF1S-7]MCG7533749.1 endonuclease SmrB [Pseudoalteromonas sp. OOF1S-7]